MSSASPLLHAIDRDAYDWLSHNAPYYVDAIQAELQAGKTPEQMKRVVLKNAGAERSALALRIEQAARYLQVQTDRDGA